MRYVLLFLIFTLINCKQENSSSGSNAYIQIWDSLNIDNLNKLFTTGPYELYFSKRIRGELYTSDYSSSVRIVAINNENISNPVVSLDSTLKVGNNFSDIFLRPNESMVNGDTVLIKYSICPEGEDDCENYILKLVL